MNNVITTFCQRRNEQRATERRAHYQKQWSAMWEELSDRQRRGDERETQRLREQYGPEVGNE